MYSRVLANSADPGGRGPNSSCLRTCVMARSPLKATALGTTSETFAGRVATPTLPPSGGALRGHAMKRKGPRRPKVVGPRHRKTNVLIKVFRILYPLRIRILLPLLSGGRAEDLTRVRDSSSFSDSRLFRRQSAQSPMMRSRCCSTSNLCFAAIAS